MATQFPITPEVPADVLAAVKTVESDPSSVQNDVSALQKLVRSDKSAVVAGIVHVAVLLLAAFRLHLTGRDVAELGSVVSVGLSYFVGLNIRTRAKIKL